MVFVRFLNPLLMIVLGLAVGVVAAGKQSNAWRYYFVGMATFVLSQVLHIPFNAWVLSGFLDGLSRSGAELIVFSAALGLSAGVFEEVARYLAYRFAIRDARSWRDGLMFGAGHGGIEAIMLGLLTLYTVMQLVALSGEGAPALQESVPVEDLARVQAQVAVFWSLPWYAVLLGALERLFAILFHLAASLLVLQVFRRGRLFWLLLAVGYHAFLDAAVVYVSAVWGIYWAEAVLAVLALGSLGIIRWLGDEPETPPEGEPAPEPAAELLALGRVELSEEDLDDSRYR